VARHPAQALVETPSELFLAHPLLVQGRKKPALLELRESLRAALAAVQQQRVALAEIPRRRRHRVGAQSLQTTQTLESVDDQIALGRQRDDDNRYLLAMLGQRRQQAALTLRALTAQDFMAAIQLVKLQIHGAPPKGWRTLRQRGEVWPISDLVFSGFAPT
jgi:hypothetical protein